MLAQLAKQDGVDAGHLLALAGHVLRVHLPKKEYTSDLFHQTVCSLKISLGKEAV